MTVERKFIKLGLKRVWLEEYLQKELEHAGYGGVEIKRIPTGTRVALYVERPGMVIGRKGKSIKQLTEDLASKYGVENPQVEVVEIKVPELCAPVMAKRIAFALERGMNFRRVGYAALRRIMNAGALGAEIIISGKLSGERAKTARFYEGYLKKAGEPAARFLSVGYAPAKLKPGIVGVKVRIMPPGVRLPDQIELKEKVKEEVKAEHMAAEEQPPTEELKKEEQEIKGEESGNSKTESNP
ncbi:MAG: 30S ribosomal protein S3 [Hadesarchaea archaeon YNP_N21]|jgi:small subunit ribosomal protein S3|nr:MAG: 30S ribosomal protein S3 [Hadesarchaea archaeon YNP_N21]